MKNILYLLILLTTFSFASNDKASFNIENQTDDYLTAMKLTTTCNDQSLQSSNSGNAKKNKTLLLVTSTCNTLSSVTLEFTTVNNQSIFCIFNSHQSLDGVIYPTVNNTYYITLLNKNGYVAVFENDIKENKKGGEVTCNRI